MKASDEMSTAFRTRSVFALFHSIREHHEEAADANVMIDMVTVKALGRRMKYIFEHPNRKWSRCSP
jgi:hypothetical protein